MRLASLKRVYTKYMGEDLPLDTRFANIFFIGSILKVFISILLLLFVSMRWQGIFFCCTLELFLIAMFWIAQREKNQKFVVQVSLLFMNFFFLPMIFLTAGGISGGVVSFCILGIVCSFFMFDGFAGTVIIGLEFIVTILLMIASYAWAEQISPLANASYKYFIIPINVLFSSAVIGAIARLFLEQFKKEKSNVDDLIGRLEDLAQRDPLTGLYNRGYLIDFLEAQIASRQEKPSALSMIIFDLDWFKQINDQYGHMKGDQVIKKVADLLQLCVQQNGIVGRYGGEEFIAVFPEVHEEVAFLYAEQIRTEIASSTPLAAITRPVTISGGVAEYQSGMSVEDFIKEADENLYLAKKAGRNRICKNFNITV